MFLRTAMTIEEPFALILSLSKNRSGAASDLTGNAYRHQCFVSICTALPFDRLRANGSMHGFSIDDNHGISMNLKKTILKFMDCVQFCSSKQMTQGERYEVQIGCLAFGMLKILPMRPHSRVNHGKP